MESAHVNGKLLQCKTQHKHARMMGMYLGMCRAQTRKGHRHTQAHEMCYCEEVFRLERGLPWLIPRSEDRCGKKLFLLVIGSLGKQNYKN